MKLGGFPERIWRHRVGRPLALLAVLVLLATIAWPGPRRLPQGAGDAMLQVTPIPLDATAPARRDVGRLRFLGGWALASADGRFGGLSGLHVENGEVLAVSDAGMVIRFALPGAGQGAAAVPVQFAPLIEGPGPHQRRSSRDSEAMLVDGGRLWIAYEGHNMVWRYDRASLRALSAARPGPMRRWPGNSGPEAMVRLADGRFLLLSEGRDDGQPYSEAVLFAGDAAVPGTPAARLRYRRPPGYRVTDAALLPDGRVLILNRRLAWLRFSAKLAVADVSRLAAGGMIAPEEVATLEAPLAIDNYEGLAVTREAGRTIVWLVTDDDFMRIFRRTLLMKFELRP